jgi:hypothetical protein
MVMRVCHHVLSGRDVAGVVKKEWPHTESTESTEFLLPFPPSRVWGHDFRGLLR